MPANNLPSGGHYTIHPNQNNLVNFQITVHNNTGPAQATIIIMNGQVQQATQVVNLNPMQVRNVPYNPAFQYVITNSGGAVGLAAGLDIVP